MSRRKIGTASLLVGLGTGAAAAGVLVARYRREMKVCQARWDAFDREVITSRFGDIEYADIGTGEPILLSHGIYQGCDGALLFRDYVPERRIVAPSRFGYFGSTLPAGATLADQAEAYVTLLDELDIAEIDIIGSSAGTTSALQLALRHPERVNHLVVLSGNLPGTTTAVAQRSWARYVDRQIPVWIIKTLAPSTMRYTSGVPRGFPLIAEDAKFVTMFFDSMFPITLKLAGVLFDAFVSNANVNGYPLESIRVPTLVVHTRDDPLIHYDSAARAAHRIPGARLVGLVSGGHLMLGQTPAVRAELAIFLTRTDAA
jgi:pimeloyl-ACP methyl ester carboxylesterase